ncbi:MAG: type IV pilus biogenesis protein PilM [bacterium]
MAKEANRGVIGISIRDTALRMTELQPGSDEAKITKLSQGKVKSPFQFSVFKDEALTHKLAEDINRLYEISSFQAQQATFTLDSNMVSIKKVPIDTSLKGQRLQDHVHWEIEQCFINPRDEYIIDFEHVPSTPDQEYAEAIIVAVRRAVVNFLKKVFRETDLRLAAIDVDVFAAHRVLQANYETVRDVYTAMVDLRKDNLQFAIVKDRTFLLAQEVDYPLEEQATPPNADEMFLPRLLSKELRRIILDHKLGKGVEEMHAVYLHGDNISDQIVHALQETHKIRIERVNPFRRIKMEDQAADPLSQTHPEAFTVCIGAALKSFA